MKTKSERAAIMFNYKNDFQKFMQVAEQQLQEYANQQTPVLGNEDIVVNVIERRVIETGLLTPEDILNLVNGMAIEILPPAGNGFKWKLEFENGNCSAVKVKV